MRIASIKGQEVLDSRGNPTVEAEVIVEGGFMGRAISPSGASTGLREAAELRDGDKSRYGGKGVLTVVDNVNRLIAQAVLPPDFADQAALDHLMIKLDGTPNKSRLGANAILAVSMAFAKASAAARQIPLYRHLHERDHYLMPVPCLNVLNGGRHSDNNVDFQEFMIAPHNASSFAESIRKGVETFHTLKGILKQKGYYTGVGDEGGFAPNLKSNEEAVELILEAIVKAGYHPGTDISICLDPASSEMWESTGEGTGQYRFYKSTQQTFTSDQMVGLWNDWVRQYPIILLEDGMAEEDWPGWQQHTRELGQQIELVGDDIFCTNPAIVQQGIDQHIANSVLIKLNQIGTVTETLDCIHLANQNNYGVFVSHRSGETEDTTIADLTVATGAGHLKTGSGCRSERIAKFNQLLRIEAQLGDAARFGEESLQKCAVIINLVGLIGKLATGPGVCLPH
ncbi:phosphopyruvate hydratase [Spirosoma utsteinense]|uniref:phosphopyruvate hydratase n=1 Tax=Spirosoma utsteinense TaxID=2585773 RepID=UPI0016443F2E|nr:phosphopyruvate hydratase [Spirosoma utsteinense]